jgi:hypothetical protein
MDEKYKVMLKKTSDFIFHSNSPWSWVVNIILAFVLVKFIIYPLLALFLGSSLPLVAVISGSMEHNGQNFETWWDENKGWYESQGITESQFESFKIKNGFNKGDVIVLVGPKRVLVGDVLVYNSGQHPYPIIHRVSFINENENTYQLKGDNNPGPDSVIVTDSMVIGRAVAVVPKIGWVKIWFTELIS